VRQLVDVNGDVLLAQSYEPYGEVLASVGEGESSYGFAAEMRDSYIKLIYLLSREYSPATGRFLTEDSWRGDYTRPLSLNGWNYVEGNPVNRIDPTGHISEKQAADADKIVAYLKSTYNIAIRKDWGWRLFATVLYNSISILPPNCQFHWETGNWQSIDELKVTRSTIINVGEKMGGVQKFKSAMEERPVSMVRVLTLPSGASGMAPPYIGAVTGDILLADTTFNRDTVDARFTIAHELAHVWDWRSGQALSNGLVKLLGGECLEDVFHGTTVCKYDPWAREDPPGSKNPDDNYASRDSWEDWADTFATYMYPQYYGKFNWNNGLSPIRRKYVIRQIQAIR
jgi:RHS repeat-associated protein